LENIKINLFHLKEGKEKMKIKNTKVNIIKNEREKDVR